MIVGGLPLASAFAEAPEDPPRKSQEHEATWVVREAGEVVGTEAIKVVLSPTDTYFFSGSYLPKGKRAVKVLTHLQRDPDGKLRKYRRLQKKRKGQGVHAFQKGELVRIVGVNDDAAPVVLEGALEHPIWDPVVWHPLEAWLAVVRGGDTPAEVSVVNVVDRKLRRVGLERVGPKTVGDADGKPVEVTEWRIAGLGETPLTVLASPGPRLVGVQQAQRLMLLEGWSWEAPAADAESPEAEGSTTEGGAESQAGDDGAAPTEDPPATDPAPVDAPAQGDPAP